MIPEWLSVIILGLIEGLTEFIPVSSTGHLLIAQQWLHRQSELFNYVIQCAAALALIPLFWTKISGMLFRFQEPKNRDLFLKLSVAFIITCIGGLVFKKLGLELPENARPVAWATLIGGVVMLAIERLRHPSKATYELTWSIVIGIAVGQLIAMTFPGASRSGSTIMIALAMGLARPAATEFSFLLGVPTLLAAGAYAILKEYTGGTVGDVNFLHLLLGCVASAVSAFVVVKWLIGFVQHHTFTGFAIYRILLGAALLFLI